LLFLLLAVFLFPIGVYCGVLGMINRRLRPLLLNGSWDFVGVLLASSGFLLVVAPAIISGQYQRNLFEFSFGRPSSPQQTLEDIWALWWSIWLLYFFVVLGGAAFLIWLRGRSTVIYNVEAQECERVFLCTLENLGLRATRVGNRYAVSIARATLPGGGADATAISAEPLSATPRPPTQLLLARDEEAIVDMDAWAAMFHVTLNWRVFRQPLRVEVERDLERGLAKLETPENSTASWFLSISTGVFLLIFLALGAVIFASMLPRR
jgi:hypothetical protein